jgi:hypothetical protein
MASVALGFTALIISNIGETQKAGAGVMKKVGENEYAEVRLSLFWTIPPLGNVVRQARSNDTR